MTHEQERPRHEGLLVLDYGSQYTLLIVRRLREIGVYAEVIDGVAKAPPEGFEFFGIVLSGGPDSVLDTDSRQLPGWVLEQDVPILGICYGFQLLVKLLGGSLRAGTKREYGNTTIKNIFNNRDFFVCKINRMIEMVFYLV